MGEDGKPITGTMEAANNSEVISQLQSMGHFPISAEPTDGAEAVTPFQWPWQRQKALGAAQITAFTRQLATLLSAGLRLDDALGASAKRAGDPAAIRVLSALQSLVQEGRSFSASLSAQGAAFDPFYIAMIRAGEASGAMDVILGRLADYREQAAATRSAVISALIYPLLLLIVTMVALLVMLTFVVPQFEPLFADAGQALPLLTQVVFAFAHVFNRFGLLLLIAGFSGAWWARGRLAEPRVLREMYAFAMRAPYLGEIVTAVGVAQFARTLATLIANGVPLLDALDLSRGVVRNPVIADAIQEAREAISEGRSLASTLEEHDWMPPLALQLISVGETSGELESMLEKTASTYESEVQTTIKRFLTVLEPALILGLGGVIAIFIVAILMAMLAMNSLVI